jgi:hypothetical protein
VVGLATGPKPGAVSCACAQLAAAASNSALVNHRPDSIARGGDLVGLEGGPTTLRGVRTSMHDRPSDALP